MIEYGDTESFRQARGTCFYATNSQKTPVVLVDASRKRRGCMVGPQDLSLVSLHAYPLNGGERNSSPSRISIGKSKSRGSPGLIFKECYIAALTRAMKESAFRLAPPISPPSISD